MRKKKESAAVRATKKYQAKAYDRISLVLYKGEREIITEYCKEKGISVNGLINELIAREIPQINERRLFGEGHDN